MMSMEYLNEIVLGICLLGTVGVSVWAVMKKKEAQSQVLRLQSELDVACYTNENNKAGLAERDKEIAVVKEQIRQSQKMLEEYEKRNAEAQKNLKDAFHTMAGEALGQSTEQFLKLAKKQFELEKEDVNNRVARAKLEAEGRQAMNQKAIESMIQPMGKQLEQYQKLVSEMEHARKQSYGSLNEQITRMREDQARLKNETANLVTALRRPEVRGRWGEMQLKRVAELAGMINYCDFSEQVQLDSGRLRPDMVVNLPAGRQIVVDAKTPLDAYLSALEAEEPEQREAHYEHHVKQIESKVAELSKKDYQKQFDRAPDFVILFIPGDSFLQAAVMRRPQLQEEAMAKNVIIATPSTLIALLKAVAVGWREEKVAENARKISELGKELYKRLGTAVEHMTKLGKSLTSTVEHYNKFVGSFDTKVMPQARRFDELGIEIVKALPDDLPLIEVNTRPIKTLPQSSDHPEIDSLSEKPQAISNKRNEPNATSVTSDTAVKDQIPAVADNAIRETTTPGQSENKSSPSQLEPSSKETQKKQTSRPQKINSSGMTSPNSNVSNSPKPNPAGFELKDRSKIIGVKKERHQK